jgi:hypothetical protein
MLFFDAPVENDALTAFVRQVPFDSNLGLTNLFGRRDVETNTVDFAEITRTNRMARYRSFDGRIHVSARDTGSEKRVPMIPLSTSLNMGEYERLQLQFAALQGGNTARLARAVYNDAEQLTREVQNRIEMAWGDTLSDGILTISEGGITGTAGITDYGVPANQKTTVGTAWTTVATAPALSDIQTVIDVRVDTNGNSRPGYMLTSNAQIRNLRRNKQIIDAVYGSTSGRTQVSLNELRTLLADEFNGLTLLNSYDSSFDVDGVTTRTIPNDKVMFLPADLENFGYTAWGVSATALELVNSNRSELSFEQAAGIVGVVIKEGPPFREFVFTDAVAIPVIADARGLSVLDVIP